jgi:uncharacterized protein YjbJ (UPF0337 family)
MKVKDSTHDRVEGTAKQIRGRTKIAAGKVTGSTRLKVKGALDMLDGKVQQKIGNAERRRGR